MKKLKLNYKRTLIIGFAFFSILMVWQGYNFYCPLFLRHLLSDILEKNNATEYSEFIVGVIMALDNVLALFMLPIFGKLSDRTNTKYGKRMPFIILGMIATMIAYPFMALCYLWNSLVGLIITMLIVLIIMNIYRSPAVALMPDVTPKPLRSTANGLINLVGYFGPILITVVNMIPFITFSQGDKGLVHLLIPVLVVEVSLLIAIIVLVLKIKENKILDEMQEDLKLGEELSLTEEKVEEDKPLSKRDKRNMIILLIAVCFWFMSFNAIETFNSTYFDEYYTEMSINEEEYNSDETYYIISDDDNPDYTIDGNSYHEISFSEADFYNYSGDIYIKSYKGSSIASLATIILTVSAVVTFAVAGFFAVKFGRKPNIIVGILCLIIGFFVINFIKSNSFIIYIMFFLVGTGWALINVNSYPMMVEMSSSKNIGKFTGMYYTASMIAQSVTPILLGGIIAFIPSVTLRHLFIYAAIMALIALILIIFFKENRDKVKEIKKGLSAFDQD
ncbi:MAG: MFS transporter [Acholeplasmatales bacterium]|nr:MFS transporter [Acholeplasmatales bacterium]